MSARSSSEDMEDMEAVGFTLAEEPLPDGNGEMVEQRLSTRSTPPPVRRGADQLPVDWA